jgi:hypothetical protein
VKAAKGLLTRKLLVGIIIGVAIGAAATAVAARRDVVIPRGQGATFAGTGSQGMLPWSCFNRATLYCLSGDAHPNATLSKNAITIRVFALRRPCVRRVLRPSPDPTDPNFSPYYEFTYAFKAVGRC